MLPPNQPTEPKHSGGQRSPLSLPKGSVAAINLNPTRQPTKPAASRTNPSTEPMAATHPGAVRRPAKRRRPLVRTAPKGAAQVRGGLLASYRGCRRLDKTPTAYCYTSRGLGGEYAPREGAKSGGGGNRTRVQRKSRASFYMLSRPFDLVPYPVGRRTEKGTSLVNLGHAPQTCAQPSPLIFESRARRHGLFIAAL